MVEEERGRGCVMMAICVLVPTFTCCKEALSQWSPFRWYDDLACAGKKNFTIFSVPENKPPVPKP